MKRSKSFLILIVVTAVGAVLCNFAVIVFFDPGDVPFGELVKRFLPMALAYVVAVSVLLRTLGKEP